MSGASWQFWPGCRLSLEGSGKELSKSTSRALEVDEHPEKPIALGESFESHGVDSIFGRNAQSADSWARAANHIHTFT